MKIERKLGCIPSKVQAVQAKEYGSKSDVERIAELAAPWDATDQPTIIEWDSKWKAKLEYDARINDIIRDKLQFPHVWDIAKGFGYDLDELCMSYQKTNDCTAWGTSRSAVCLALYQKYFGAEIDVETLNPMGIYAYSSGSTPNAGVRFADNGRTIYAIAEASCQTGNFPASAIGDYDGKARFTQKMIDSTSIAQKNQMGFVYLGNEDHTAEELADIVILSLRACKPVIVGNTVALRDGTSKNSDGIYVSEVGGGWGGGHCTAFVDIAKVGDNYYPWNYNSHGPIYHADDGSPDGGTFIDRKSLIKFFSGSYVDVMLTTYVERPRVENTNLNPVLGGQNG